MIDRTVGGQWLRTAVTVTSIVFAAVVSAIAEADQDRSPASSPDRPLAIDGPPAPIAPDVIARGASGRATIRAVRLASPLRVDGRLDEEIYATVRPASGLIQMEPQGGASASEKTDLWVTFDGERFYVSLRCWESHPERLIANEMRRDNNDIFQNDYVAIVLDTFYDRRNASYFAVTPIGGRADGQIANERQYISDWNTVWDVETHRFDGGWSVEFTIPFKSLRYRPGDTQVWGLNVERRSRWRNEETFLTRIPASFGFNRAFMQVSYAASLIGVEVPPGSKKPRSQALRDISPAERHWRGAGARQRRQQRRRSRREVRARAEPDDGLHAEHGFCAGRGRRAARQPDALQPVLPRKAGILSREPGDVRIRRRGHERGTGRHQRHADSVLQPADWPRRPAPEPGPHGSDSGRRSRDRARRTIQRRRPEHPDRRGFRVRVAADHLFRNAAEARRVPAQQRRPAVYRPSAGPGGLRDEPDGIDGTFAFFDNLSFNTYWARMHTRGLQGEDTSYRAQVDYAADKYGVQIERLVVGAHFNPEVGFVRRSDMRRSFGLLRYSPRPRSSKRIRKLYWIGSIAYIENGSGQLETRDVETEFDIEFHNSDKFILGRSDNFEWLARPFTVAPRVIVPSAGYTFGTTRAGYNFGQQRMISGNVLAEYGTFYSGRRMAISATGNRAKVTPHFSLEPTASVNWVDLREGSFTARLFGSRVTYAMTPRMFTSALVQYNTTTSTMAANIRMRWEYQPGSELFVVFNEERDTTAPRFPTLANRGLIVKINRLFRYSSCPVH